MFVFIAHAEADQAAADELKAFLKSRGLVVETETGAKGFRHLQPSDVVIALWSQKSVFAAHRMQIERRMLEAWEDERLVLVKLDHSFLPVGLRDLAAIDASFETARSLSGWPQVERAAREAMNRALVARQSRDEAPRETIGTGSGGPAPASPNVLNSRYGDMTSAMGKSAKHVAVGEDSVAAPAKRRGSSLPVLFLLIAVGALGWAGWEVFLRPESTLLLTNVAYGVAVLGVVLLLWIFAQALRPAPKAKAATARRAAAAPPPAAAPQPLATAVFISYAHADSGAVEPVVKIVRSSGREVWIDKGGIQAGEGWAGEIVRAIKGAKSVVVMCSSHAFESDHIKREVYLADRYRKPMFPVFLEAAKMPEDFEYFFAGVQWLELFRLPEADKPDAITKALATA